MTTALVTATRAGRTAAAELADRWSDTRTYSVGDLAAAWRECDQLVVFLAVGAAVRLLAPLLDDKRRDPGVVCVDEARRFAVALVGGHAAGANALAARVAGALGAEPVVTTASDAVGVSPLGTIGWPVEGDVAAVTRAMLDGEDVALVADVPFPLPPLPVSESDTARAPCVLVTDRLVDAPRPSVVVRPPTVVVGVGGSRGVSTEEVLDLVTASLSHAGVAAASVARFATVDAKRDEAG
ncbi:MAG TPA: cobalamin biosynthesis protein, partial [Frankiaceae bacterium]|nr:cobalamin biosynthesis protein [Frankiaceae bacterium]